jgi:GNAT superfamily N-acetyltransferase
LSTPGVMAEYPKTIVLTDGTHLVLRPAEVSDEPAVVAMLGQQAAPRLLAILALEGERAAATLVLGEPAAGQAVLRLGISPAYRGRRLGTWMLLDAVHVAAGLGVERLLVEAPDNDPEYIGALRRLDFVEDGRCGGTVVLTKTLHRGWPDF